MFLRHLIILTMTSTYADSHDPFHDIHITQHKDSFAVQATYAPLEAIIEQVCWALKTPCHAVDLPQKVSFGQQSFTWQSWLAWLKKDHQVEFNTHKNAFFTTPKPTPLTQKAIFKPRYQKPSTILKHHAKMASKSTRVSLKADDDANHILITFKGNQGPQIMSSLKQLDCQTPHIFAKIDIIAVEHQAFNQLDIDIMGAWAHLNSKTYHTTNLLKKMKALESKGQATLLAKPTTMLLPREKMTITNTEKTKGVGQPATLSLTMSFDFNGHDGILADVALKHIYPNGNHFNEHQFKNTVLLINKEPTLIGGLKENKTQSLEDCIPILGDIPYIGKAFCNSTTHEDDQIILIFIYPERVQRCQ